MTVHHRASSPYLIAQQSYVNNSNIERAVVFEISDVTVFQCSFIFGCEAKAAKGAGFS